MFTANAEETGHLNTQQSIIVLHYSFLASYSSDTRLQKSMFTNGFVKFNDSKLWNNYIYVFTFMKWFSRFAGFSNFLSYIKYLTNAFYV